MTGGMVQAAPAALPSASATPLVEARWRRHLRTTREGKAFLFVTVGVGIAAFNTGNNLLFLVLGFMLSLIILSGILSEVAIRGIRVSRRLPDRCHARSTTLIELTLLNKKTRAPSYSLEVEDLASGVATERRCYFLKVAPRAEQSATYRRTPARRGVLRLSGFRIATRYPFGLFEKWRIVPAAADLIVYPALVPTSEISPVFFAPGQEVTATQRGRGAEFAELRAYQEGDDARSIHFRRSAALGQLVVVERHAEAGTRLSLVLDNARPQHEGVAWDVAFERAISIAATMAIACVNKGQVVDIVVRGARSECALPGGNADAVLRFLSLLTSVPPEGAPPMAAIVAGATPWPIPVVVEGRFS